MSPTLRFFRHHHMNMLHVVLGVVALTWLAFQIFAPADQQPPVLQVALQASFGAWLADLAYDQRNREEKVIHRVEDLERGGVATNDDAARLTGRVDTLEGVADSQHPEAFGDILRQHRHERPDPGEVTDA